MDKQGSPDWGPVIGAAALLIIVCGFIYVSNNEFKEQTNKASKYDAKAQMIRACEKIAGN